MQRLGKSHSDIVFASQWRRLSSHQKWSASGATAGQAKSLMPQQVCWPKVVADFAGRLSAYLLAANYRARSVVGQTGRTRIEHFSSGLPPKPDFSGLPRDVAEGPMHKVAALQPAARGQEPRGGSQLRGRQ